MKKTLLMTVIGAAMALMVCGSAVAEEVKYEADVKVK